MRLVRHHHDAAPLLRHQSVAHGVRMFRFYQTREVCCVCYSTRIYPLMFIDLLQYLTAIYPLITIPSPGVHEKARHAKHSSPQQPQRPLVRQDFALSPRGSVSHTQRPC